MNEFESPSRARGDAEESRRAAESTEDLRALRVSTARELPPLERYVTRARDRMRAPVTWEERLMATLQIFKGRPWLTTAVAAAVMAVVLLVIPVSYQRTAGQDVTLTVAGSTAQISGIARGLEAVLGVHGVRVEAQAEGGATRYAFKASVPEKPGVDVARLAQAYVKGLRARGFAATVSTTPRTERVWGSVYAYARDRVIRISMDGKSASELEAEIRQRLAEAGVTDAQVSVTDEGDHNRRISVEMHHPMSSGSGATTEAPPELELTRDGLPAGQNGCTIKMKKKLDGSSTTLELEVSKDGRTTSFEIPNAGALSDAALASEIQSRLRGAGFDLEVTIENGKIQVAKP